MQIRFSLLIAAYLSRFCIFNSFFSITIINFLAQFSLLVYILSKFPKIYNRLFLTTTTTTTITKEREREGKRNRLCNHHLNNSYYYKNRGIIVVKSLSLLLSLSSSSSSLLFSFRRSVSYNYFVGYSIDRSIQIRGKIIIIIHI